MRRGWVLALAALFISTACSDGGKVNTMASDTQDSLDWFGSDTPGEEDLSGQPDNGNDKDVPVADTTAPEPGAFGSPCTSNADCISGYCIEGLNGYICTDLCVEECPTGYNCVGVGSGPDLTFICVPDLDRSCEPCSSDIQCSGGKCVAFGTQKYCVMPCNGQPCKQNYQCTLMSIDGVDNELCTPTSGTCECTPNSVGLEKSCKKIAGTNVCYGVQFCEQVGWGGCQLPSEVCDGKDNDCNGYVDEPWLNIATNKYESDSNCGVCGNSCLNMDAANASGRCSALTTVPSCIWECDNGYFDVNNNPNDGCECKYASDKDDPDVAGDANCDGIEGVVTGGIFVSKSGNDNAAGGQGAPVRTISKAITLAKQKAGSGTYNVYVATGVYNESVMLQQGVHVYGGYSSDFRTRDAVLNQTAIMGATATTDKPGAVNAFDISKETVFSGFYVFGADAMESGGSSYAMYVVRCNQFLKLVGNTVVAGNGRAGSQGTGGNDGKDGVDGTEGEGAYDIMTETCASYHWTFEGVGGINTCEGMDVSGGDGGSGICPDYDESGTQPASIPYDQVQTASELGKAGSGPAGGAGGIAGWDSLIHDGGSSNCSICNVPKKPDGSLFLPTLGANGAVGTAGTNGNPAGGCSDGDGTVSGNLWVGVQGQKGGNGSHGSGGGGGGAGGGVETKNCSGYPKMKYTDMGGGGGGGGSGGCAGTGGGGGTPGGGSFGLFIVAVGGGGVPTLTNNHVQTGFGGDGGAGGTGGVGGKAGAGRPGGDSGEGIESAWCADAGGHGGNGGSGGHGGGGGGGCGGPSFAIYVHNASGTATASWLNDNSFALLGQAGYGGQGGKSLGNSGTDGDSGASGKINSL